MYGKQTIYKDTEGINSFEWIGEKQDISSTECKLISKIVINLDADFSKLKESENFADESFLDKSINEENADYVIKLKVGQKCKIESDEEITGYAVSGSGSVEFNDDKNEITAKGEGKVNGYLYVGENNSTKSIYVVIEENPGNQTVEPISIKIEGKANADPTPVTTPTPSTTPTITPTPTATPVPSTSPTPVATPVKTSVPTSTPKVTTTNSTAGIVLPKAGNSNAFAIVGICICIVSAIIYAIKIKNLKNIK